VSRKIGPQALWPDPPPAPQKRQVLEYFLCENCGTPFRRPSFWLPGSITEPNVMMAATSASHECDAETIGLARCIAIRPVGDDERVIEHINSATGKIDGYDVFPKVETS